MLALTYSSIRSLSPMASPSTVTCSPPVLNTTSEKKVRKLWNSNKKIDELFRGYSLLDHENGFVLTKEKTIPALIQHLHKKSQPSLANLISHLIKTRPSGNIPHMLGIMVRHKGSVDPDNFFHIHPAPSPSKFISLGPGTKYSYSECKKDYTVKHQSGSDAIACEKPENSTILQMPSRRICFFDPHHISHAPPGRLSKKSAPRLLFTYTKDFAPFKPWDRDEL